LKGGVKNQIASFNQQLMEKMHTFDPTQARTLQNQKLYHLSNQTSQAGSQGGSYLKMLPTPDGSMPPLNASQTQQNHYRRLPGAGNPTTAPPLNPPGRKGHAAGPMVSMHQDY